MSLTDELEALLASALDELAYDPPALAFLAPGQNVAWDECCAGQLWVRVLYMHPVNPLPQKVLSTAANCPYPLGAKIGLGIIRCQSGLERLDEGTFPTEANLTDDAERMLCDAAALFRALQCDQDLLVDMWTPLGPQGGCYGGEWTAWIGDFDLPNCGEESE